jgi:predicted translin family RNA/ssDNA-binding protein
MVNNIDDDIEDYKKAYKQTAEKINNFTTLLNKYNQDYKVIYYDDVVSIELDEVEILFYIKEDGAIKFKSKIEIGEQTK